MQSCILLLIEEDGHEVIHYFADEEAADAAVADSALHDALSAIGAWSDFDSEEMEAMLDSIRHVSRPTPPITDL